MVSNVSCLFANVLDCHAIPQNKLNFVYRTIFAEIIKKIWKEFFSDSQTITKLATCLENLCTYHVLTNFSTWIKCTHHVSDKMMINVTMTTQYLHRELRIYCGLSLLMSTVQYLRCKHWYFIPPGRHYKWAVAQGRLPLSTSSLSLKGNISELIYILRIHIMFKSYTV